MQSIQYVKICSLYGVGFYYIPGTDMCIKVGGWARQEVAYGYNGSMTTGFFSNNLNNRTTDNLTWRYKGTVTVDSRNQTEYGTVRSYVAIGASSNFNDNEGAGLYANRWFIQWAGFTFGHATSFYDFYSVGANQFGFVTAGADSGDGGHDVIAYTAQFGNGLSATIAAEATRRTKITAAGTAAGASYTPAAWAAYGTNYAGTNTPDLVANLRVDQAWGSAQIMGALHQVNANYYGASEGTGYPSDKWGFAIGGGLKLNAPMIGAGDYLQVEATYTQGALRYNNNTALTGDFVKYDGNSIGFGVQSDAVYGGTVGTNASDLELTSAWSVNAAYTHFWNAKWKTTLWGSYMSVMYGSNANAMLCSSIGEGTGSGTTAVAAVGCDMDWSVWGLGLRTQWNVTKDFYLGLEVLYANLNSASVSGGTVTLGANSTKPAGAYSVSDQDSWAVRFRAHKDFYP